VYAADHDVYQGPELITAVANVRTSLGRGIHLMLVMGRKRWSGARSSRRGWAAARAGAGARLRKQAFEYRVGLVLLTVVFIRVAFANAKKCTGLPGRAVPADVRILGLC
jgi:hypothetical protein